MAPDPTIDRPGNVPADITDSAGRFTLLRAFADNARRARDDAFVEWFGRSLSYGEFWDLIVRFANGLRERGIRPREHVMVFMQNSPEYLIAMFGIQLADCVYVTCSSHSQDDEISYQLEHSESVAVVTDAAERLEGIVSSLARPVQVLRSEVSTTTPGAGVGSLLSRDGTTSRPFPDPDALGVIMYTSGTTSRPKGVMWTHAQFYVSAQRFMLALHYTRGERLLHYFPLYHANGGSALLGPIVLVAGTLVLHDRFSASSFSKDLVDNRITMVALNASHAKMILSKPPTEFDRAHRVERGQFALFLDRERRDEFEQRFGIRLVEIYGLTESLGIATASPAYANRTMASAGPPVPGLEIKIVGADGEAASRGTPGELLVKADTPRGLCAGYYKDAAATDELMAGGWLHTGDVGFIDDDGCFVFLERDKDMIKRSGFNVAAAEVERVLIDHPSLTEASVVSIPDEFREEAIVAYVVSDPARTRPTAEDVIEFCRGQLASYKLPEHIVFVEAIPVNFIGKVDKKALRAQARAELG